jgi:hypothetical protein
MSSALSNAGLSFRNSQAARAREFGKDLKALVCSGATVMHAVAPPSSDMCTIRSAVLQKEWRVFWSLFLRMPTCLPRDRRRLKMRMTQKRDQQIGRHLTHKTHNVDHEKSSAVQRISALPCG